MGVGITNPYGQTKFDIEKIMQAVAKEEDGDTWALIRLRYFNPVGAHPSGLIGEEPNGIPNNLMPFISQVATGQRKSLTIFGHHFDTPDGTGLRDYIHVVDLAKGHVKALKYMEKTGFPIDEAINLGSGKPVSVLEMVTAFKRSCKCKVPYTFGHRRAGDLAASYAIPAKAKALLGWEALKTVDDMTSDTWNWKQKSAGGFKHCKRAKTLNFSYSRSGAQDAVYLNGTRA